MGPHNVLIPLIKHNKKACLANSNFFKQMRENDSKKNSEINCMLKGVVAKIIFLISSFRYT